MPWIKRWRTLQRELEGERAAREAAEAANARLARKLLKITHLDEATVFRATLDEATEALAEGGTPQY